MDHVAIVIPTIRPENAPYLDLALRSIRNLNYDQGKIEVVVVASNGYLPRVPDGVKLASVDRRMHFSEAVNTGIQLAGRKADHYLILSDDCFLTKNSLRNMVRQVQGDCLIGPISNCEQRLRYSLAMGYVDENKNFRQFDAPQYRFDDLKDHVGKLMNADSLYPPGLWLTAFLCFFSVLIPRRVWERVGMLDERFKSGQEDTDYCGRAKALGIPTFVCLDSLIWHYGGVSAETMVTEQDRKENIQYFNDKHKGHISLNDTFL